jgi:hypothetical protein
MDRAIRFFISFGLLESWNLAGRAFAPRGKGAAKSHFRNLRRALEQALFRF